MPIDAGTGVVLILPQVNPAQFQGAIAKAMAPAQATAATQATKIGQTFSQKLAGSLGQAAKSFGSFFAIGLGVTAVASIGKMTLAFEDAFIRIAALSNASREQIALWREEVFTLGRETATAPQELADGLFYLASAGLDANQIFPALEASAKAAAVGLGEMDDITRSVINVLNAYPEAGYDAIDVTDALVAAVREGTAAPDEFAEAIGRILPIASKAAVGMEEIVASMAALSNIGLDPAEAVTGLRQILNLIVSPGKQATDTLNEFGISTDSLRDRLAEGGVLDLLRFLEQVIGDDDAAFRKILPNIRAMTAAFGLTGQEAAKLDGIFQRVANATGDTNKALEETQAGPGFRFRQMLERLTELAIRLGQALLPVATAIGGIANAILGPLSATLGVLAKFTSLIEAVALGFATWAALRWIPTFLATITIQLVRVTGASLTAQGAVSGFFDRFIISNTAAASLGRAVGWLSLFALGIKEFGDAVTAADRKNVTEWRREIARFGPDSREAADEVALLHARTRALALGGPPRPGAITEEIVREGDRAVALLDQSLSAAHRANELRELTVTEFQEDVKSMGEGLTPAFKAFADFTGQSLPEFNKGLRDALAAGMENSKTWSDYVAKQVDKAADTFDDFSQDVSENLFFAGDALADMSSEASSAQRELAEGTDATGDALVQLRETANLTREEVLETLRDAGERMREFGRDLLKISKIPRGGEDVAVFLQSLGEGGVALADVLAEAPRAFRRNFIEGFQAQQRFADRTAEILTRRILGTLKQIRDMFREIAINFGLIKPKVDVGGNAAETLPLIQDRLFEIDGYVANATVNIVRHITEDTASTESREGPGPRDFDPTVHTARGAIIPAQRGVVTRRPTLLTGEGGYSTFVNKGSEAVMPLDDRMMSRLGSAVAGHIELPTIVVKVGEEELARTVSRGQRRRRSLVGA